MENIVDMIQRMGPEKALAEIGKALKSIFFGRVRGLPQPVSHV